MNKKLLSLLLGVAMLAPTASMAVGLGSIRTNSNLNEKLNAVIPVLSLRDKSRLTVTLAPNAEFAKRGIRRSGDLNALRFSTYQKGGRTYIRVSSNAPINTPYLNFIVQLNSNEGIVSREYAVFLDPPSSKSKTKKATAKPRLATGKSTKSTKPRVTTKKATPKATKRTATAAKKAPAKSNGKSGRYGPVRDGETLWSIAAHVRPAGVSIHQMLDELRSANPRLSKGLQTGMTLVVPSVGGSKAYRGGYAPMPGTKKTDSTKKTAKKTKPKKDSLERQLRENHAKKTKKKPSKAVAKVEKPKAIPKAVTKPKPKPQKPKVKEVAKTAAVVATTQAEPIVEQQTIKPISKKVESVSDGLQSTVTTATEKNTSSVAAATDSIAERSGQLADAASATAKTAVDDVTSMADSAGKAIGDVTKNVGEKASAATATATTAVSDGLGKLATTGSAALDKAKTATGEVADKTGEVLNDATSKVGEVADDVSKKAGEMSEQAGEKMADATGEAKAVIKSIPRKDSDTVAGDTATDDMTDATDANVDDGLVSLDAGEDVADTTLPADNAEEAAPIAEAVAEETKAETDSASAETATATTGVAATETSVDDSDSEGFVQKATTAITENLPIAGGGAAILLGLGGLLMMRKRRKAAAGADTSNVVLLDEDDMDEVIVSDDDALSLNDKETLSDEDLQILNDNLTAEGDSDSHAELSDSEVGIADLDNDDLDEVQTAADFDQALDTLSADDAAADLSTQTFSSENDVIDTFDNVVSEEDDTSDFITSTAENDFDALVAEDVVEDKAGDKADDKPSDEPKEKGKTTGWSYSFGGVTPNKAKQVASKAATAATATTANVAEKTGELATGAVEQVSDKLQGTQDTVSDELDGIDFDNALLGLDDSISESKGEAPTTTYMDDLAAGVEFEQAQSVVDAAGEELADSTASVETNISGDSGIDFELDDSDKVSKSLLEEANAAEQRAKEALQAIEKKGDALERPELSLVGDDDLSADDFEVVEEATPTLGTVMADKNAKPDRNSVDMKLDLAKSFLSIGDGARGEDLLKEVLEHGSDDQVAEAKRLLVEQQQS